MAKRGHKSEKITPEDERRRDALLARLEQLGVQIDSSPAKPPGIEDTFRHRLQDFLQELSPEDQENLIRGALGLAALDIAPALGGIFPGFLPGNTWGEKWQVAQERLSQCQGPEAFAAGLVLGWAFGRQAAGILWGRDARRGAHGRPGKPGPLRWALTQVAKKQGTNEENEVLKALQNHNLIEDLFCSTGDDRIDLHNFEIEASGALSATNRAGEDLTWKRGTVRTYLSQIVVEPTQDSMKNPFP